MHEVLGLFECDSGRLIVSDPCYGRRHIQVQTPPGVIQIATMLENVRQGTYAAEVIRKSDVNMELVIWHREVFDQDVLRKYVLSGPEALGCWIPYTESKEHPKLVIGVDSGQAGFFNEPNYPVDPDFTGDYEDRQSFYGIACYISSKTRLQAGIIGASQTRGSGVVSQSGYGDGCCTLQIMRNDQQQIVACRLIFLTDAELEVDDRVDIDNGEDEEIREPVCAVYCGEDKSDYSDVSDLQSELDSEEENDNDGE